MYGPSVKGNLSPVCKVEVAINSTSLADEFEKHFQVCFFFSIIFEFFF